jgi:hypothetical protein
VQLNCTDIDRIMRRAIMEEVVTPRIMKNADIEIDLT